MKRKTSRRRVDVNVEELDRIIDEARSAPLSESDSQKLKTALHALAERLRPQRKTEKTSAVFEDAETPAPDDSARAEACSGHGRNDSAAYRRGAKTIRIAHDKLAYGDSCPECARGNVYLQKEPRALVRIVGQAPLAATVYELERLRCNARGQVFTAEEPEGVGPEKYDETASAMIAQLNYGSGIPFYRLESLEEQLGIPLPAATQWDIVEEAAEAIKPAHEELIRQAAQGEVLHNDDTSMRVLRMEREPSDERTGVFTSGIVSTGEGRNIALYFTGRQHAGENMADVLRQRAAELPSPISDVRCPVAQRAEAERRSGGSAGQLPGAWETAVRGGGRELPGRVPLRAGYAGTGVRSRGRGARTRADAAAAAGVASAAQCAGDGRVAQMAGEAVRGTQDGTELRAGQGHHLLTAALAAADAVSA